MRPAGSGTSCEALGGRTLGSLSISCVYSTLAGRRCRHGDVGRLLVGVASSRRIVGCHYSIFRSFLHFPGLHSSLSTLLMGLGSLHRVRHFRGSARTSSL